MKLKKLLLGTALLLGTVSFAQDDCLKQYVIATDAMRAQDYAKAGTAFIRGENICDDYNKDKYAYMISTFEQNFANATDPKVKAAYLDTLIGAYERAQAKHGASADWSLRQGYYNLITNPARRVAGDEALKIGVDLSQEKTDQAYIDAYYGNLYALWLEETDPEKKAAYKKRMIEEYFRLTDYINTAKMGPQVLESINAKLDYAITKCEEVLPDINLYMQSLPEEKDARLATVKNYMTLIERKECTDSKEYAMLVDEIIKIDPTAEAQVAKAKLLRAQKKYSEAEDAFLKANSMSDDADFKSDNLYAIAKMYYDRGSYKAAHNAGLRVTGKNSNDGLIIAGNSVGKMANECGARTVDRKANWYYAVELYERAGASSAAASAKKNCPTSSDLFNQNIKAGDTTTLEC